MFLQPSKYNGVKKFVDVTAIFRLINISIILAVDTQQCYVQGQYTDLTQPNCSY
jgi:hypothetical protein